MVALWCFVCCFCWFVRELHDEALAWFEGDGEFVVGYGVWCAGDAVGECCMAGAEFEPPGVGVVGVAVADEEQCLAVVVAPDGEEFLLAGEGDGDGAGIGAVEEGGVGLPDVVDGAYVAGEWFKCVAVGPVEGADPEEGEGFDGVVAAVFVGEVEAEVDGVPFEELDACVYEGYGGEHGAEGDDESGVVASCCLPGVPEGKAGGVVVFSGGEEWYGYAGAVEVVEEAPDVDDVFDDEGE